MNRSWDDDTLTAIHAPPRPVPHTAPRRPFFPRTWRDAAYAAGVLLLVSASMPFLVLAWVLLGRPR